MRLHPEAARGHDPAQRVDASPLDAGEDLDFYRVITGPPDHRRSPDITKPTTVVLHGVGYVKVFAIGEMLALPEWDDSHRHADRWPWWFPIRVDIWVPDIEDGPRTSGLVSPRALGRIQLGGEFSKLSAEEFGRIRGALLAADGAGARIRGWMRRAGDDRRRR